MIYVWNTLIVATVAQILEDLRVELHGTGLLKDLHDVGSDIMLTCPFHKGGRERKPSCGMLKSELIKDGKTYEAGTVHCYTCGYTADLPQFMADVLELSDRFAGFKWLLGRYTYGIGDKRAEIELNMDRSPAKQPEEVLVTYYQKHLLENPHAQEYLIKRKLPQEVWERFGLGYDPENDGVVIPIQNRHGLVVMVKERSITGKSFLNSKGSNKAGLVFGLYQAVQTDPMGERIWWVVESEIDAMTLWGWGEIAVAIMGSHISEKQVEELGKSPCRKLIAGLDNDEAGRKGCRLLKDKLIPKGFRIFNLQWNTDKKDINELTRAEKEELKIF